MNIRTGFGYDVHKLVKKRKLILGGVEIPSMKGLMGHSDADVLLHAISDSLLGAIAKEDIGAHFPDTDTSYKNISSLVLLEEVAFLVRESCYTIQNIDTTVVLEEPKIASYTAQMRKNIAAILNIHLDQISIKATTNEGLGDIGKGLGAAAYAISTIQKLK
jgi:2-C-methyl-D-erythritol 2,4-cyclodiphosphate synthase